MSATQTTTESRYVEVNGWPVHYIDEGEGETVLFLHGNPTSSFLWRNIIAELKDDYRCLAPDLIGMGKSYKPPVNYTFHDHYQIVKGFIEKVNLQRITLVMHDWGSALGFYYAMNYPEKIKAMVFMEAMVRPWKSKDLRWFHLMAFRVIRSPLMGELFIYIFNGFLNFVIPALTDKKLDKDIMKSYKKPFRKLASRKPMLVFPREIPIDGKPAAMHNIFNQYSQFLRSSNIPKLLLYAEPGAIIDKSTRKWCEENMSHLKMINIGKGLHFLPEEKPETISRIMMNWINEWNML